MINRIVTSLVLAISVAAAPPAHAASDTSSYTEIAATMYKAARNRAASEQHVPQKERVQNQLNELVAKGHLNAAEAGVLWQLTEDNPPLSVVAEELDRVDETLLGALYVEVLGSEDTETYASNGDNPGIDLLGEMAEGALIGAGIGSLIGGSVGASIGAAVGAIVAAVGALFGGGDDRGNDPGGEDGEGGEDGDGGEGGEGGS